MEVVLVGELNPYGGDPKFALFDLPVNSAGWRLRNHILRVERRTYFGFKRHNLCVGRWSNDDARREAGRLYLEVYDSRRVEATFVLLGKKVAAAFGHRAVDPFTRDAVHPGDQPGRLVFLPHPSGRCRTYNDPKSYERVLELLREAIPHVPWGELSRANPPR